MSEASSNEYQPDAVSPPGETLLEIIEDQGMTVAELAERTGIAPATIYEIINGDVSITPEIAAQFERVLGASADFWSSHELQYRTHFARYRRGIPIRKDYMEGKPGLIAEPWYNFHNQCIVYQTADEATYNEPIDDVLTLYRSAIDGRVIGIEIKCAGGTK